MRTALLCLAAFGLVACTKSRSPEPARSTTTTTTSADAPASEGMVRADHVRAVLRREHPELEGDIEALVIIESQGTITLAGDVSSGRARSQIVETVRGIEGIREVRDVTRVKAAAPPPR